MTPHYGLLTLFDFLYMTRQNGDVELTESQYQRIADCLPRQRGNVSMTNLQLLNALLYIVEHGCKWRGLPRHFGNWHTIYTRMNRWSKAGVLDRVFSRLQQEQILAVRIEQVCLDSTTIKVHPDGTGALKKTALNPSDVPEAAAPPRFIWLPRMLGAP
jgi:transposase